MGLNWFLKKACLIKHFQNHGDWVSNGVHLKTSCSIYNLINTSIKQAFWDWITCKWKNAGSSLSTTGFQVPIPSVMIHSTIFVIWPFGMFDSLPMRHFQTQSSYYWPKKHQMVGLISVFNGEFHRFIGSQQFQVPNLGVQFPL